LIDEEFLMHSDKKWREKLDEKGMKKKIKKEEKMVMRELKKDTLALQAEKQKIRSQRITTNLKASFRGGNAPKDESLVD